MIGPQLRSEFRKIASTRLWWGLLIPVAVLSILLGVFGGLFSAEIGTLPGDDGQLPLMLASLGYALALTSVFAALHGVVAAAGEFRHGTITTSYLGAPGRGTVLVAKAAGGAAVGALYAAVAVVLGAVSGLLGQASASVPVGALVGVSAIGVVVCALWGAFGAALGTLLTNQVTVLVVVLGYMLVGENLLSLLLLGADSPAPGRLTPYLPVNAGDVALYDVPATTIAGPRFGPRIVEGLAGVTEPASWWASLLILAAWTAAAAVAAWVIGGRRDIT